MLSRLPMDTEKGSAYSFQSEILTYAEEQELELADALALHDLSYDALVYKSSGTKAWEGPMPTQLSDLKRAPNNIPVVSFFSGCGGMDLGFETAGFKHTAAFEIDERFCKTLRRNRPHWNVFGPPLGSGDVSKTQETVAALSTLIGPKFEGVFIGGPPCQPFSVAASQRFTKLGENYKRIGFEHETHGALLLDYVSLIEYFQPVCFIVENVPGLRDLDGGEQLNLVISRLQDSGYHVESSRVVNAAHFGVPQFRERLFLVGVRTAGRFAFPKESSLLVGCGAVLPRIQGDAPNTETRTHKLASIRRYAELNYGERDQLGRVDRLDPCSPSKTVIAGGVNGGGRSHLHPEIPRTLSVRECARLQTFPDDYVFVGPTARQFTQVGNAVPPVLAAQMGIAVAESVFGV